MRQVMIGVLMDPDLEYGVGVLEGMREYVRRLPGWRVIPLDQSREALLSRLVRKGELNGLAGAFLSDRWLEGRFGGFRALVNTSSLSQVVTVSSVVPDEWAVGAQVGRHYLDLGVGRAACIADRATWSAAQRRCGFEETLRTGGVEVVRAPGCEGFRYESGWREWLMALQADTAVYCTSDALARRFHALSQGCGPEVARRVTILAGTGDSLTERVLSGLDLTSVPLPARAVGLRAAARLERLLAGETGPLCEMVAPEPLVVRGSTARFEVEDECVARALGVALQAIAQEWGVDEWARRVGVSRRTLEQRFRKAFGHGPASEIRARRMELARRLLVETDLDVAEVAARCGGGSVQAFTTSFRRACGSPPGAYRRLSRKEGAGRGVGGRVDA